MSAITQPTDIGGDYENSILAGLHAALTTARNHDSDASKLSSLCVSSQRALENCPLGRRQYKIAYRELVVTIKHAISTAESHSPQRGCGEVLSQIYRELKRVFRSQ